MTYNHDHQNSPLHQGMLGDYPSHIEAKPGTGKGLLIAFGIIACVFGGIALLSAGDSGETVTIENTSAISQTATPLEE